MFEKTLDVESYEDQLDTALYRNKIRIAELDLKLRELNRKAKERGMIA